MCTFELLLYFTSLMHFKFIFGQTLPREPPKCAIQNLLPITLLHIDRVTLCI